MADRAGIGERAQKSHHLDYLPVAEFQRTVIEPAGICDRLYQPVT